LDHFNLTSYERIASVSRRTAADRIVVDDLTFGIDAASSRAWIAALLVATSLILGTFIAGHTLGSTGWRRSNVSRDARANCLAVDLAALRVWTTRRGLTWVLRLDWGWTKEKLGVKKRTIWMEGKIRTLVGRTLDKRVSSHALRTRAHRDVIDHVTDSVLAASSRTWINAFVPDTSLVTRTVVVDDALWPTATVRVTLVLGQACALAIVALCICTARRWIARIIVDWLFR
jgi:hypothetical protein